MKKLKVILLFSILLLTFIYVYYSTYNVKSIYNDNITYLEGIVTDINYYDNKISYIIKSKENILVNDYNKISNVKLGDYVYINGTIKSPSVNTNFNLFNYKKYLLSKKINYTFTLDNIKVKSNTNLLYSFKNFVIKRLDNINNSYLYTFILADNRLDDEIYSSYQTNGISHLFAVSGMHISLISMILLYILNIIFKNKKISYIITSLFLIFYMFLTGFTASVIRSSLLFIMLAITKLFNMKIKPILILYIILISLLIYNPYYIYDIGFIYSFIISFSLMIFSNKINKSNNYFYKIFITSLIAFLVSIPITINNNFSINLLTPFINIIFVPFISFIIFPVSLLTLFIPNLNIILIFLTNILEYLSNFFLEYKIEIIMKYIPFYFVIIYYLIIYIMLYKTNKITISIFIVLICLHYNINYLNKNPILTMIDVGQGDSFLLELPHNKGNILIDTGGNINYDLASNIIIPYIKSRGIKKIDYLILTHGDYDHMGASINLVNKFNVDYVFMNGGLDNELEKSLITVLKDKKITYQKISKKVIDINGNNFYFLNIINREEENNDSLIIYTILNDYKLLFMGDATSQEEEYIMNNYNIDYIDILKVGHHGSNYSTSSNFIDSVKPNYALISVSRTNYYGHPSKRVINLLDKCGTNVYQTSINGSTKIILSDKIKIYTCLNGR